MFIAFAIVLVFAIIIAFSIYALSPKILIKNRKLVYSDNKASEIIYNKYKSYESYGKVTRDQKNNSIYLERINGTIWIDNVENEIHLDIGIDELTKRVVDDFYFAIYNEHLTEKNGKKVSDLASRWPDDWPAIASLNFKNVTIEFTEEDIQGRVLCSIIVY